MHHDAVQCQIHCICCLFHSEGDLPLQTPQGTLSFETSKRLMLNSKQTATSWYACEGCWQQPAQQWMPKGPSICMTHVRAPPSHPQGCLNGADVSHRGESKS